MREYSAGVTAGDFMLLGDGMLKPPSDDQGQEAVPLGASWGGAQKGADTVRPGIECLCLVGGSKRPETLEHGD